jgi:hypothetical protein
MIENKRLTVAETAQILGVKASTLATWRCKGPRNMKAGLPYLKMNGKVFYLLADVETYQNNNTTYHQPKEATK